MIPGGLQMESPFNPRPFVFSQPQGTLRSITVGPSFTLFFSFFLPSLHGVKIAQSKSEDLGWNSCV
jgi:hypothetical protein